MEIPINAHLPWRIVLAGRIGNQKEEMNSQIEVNQPNGYGNMEVAYI